MSQQVRVEQDLVFAGRAAYTANIKGNPMYEKVFFTDHFIADADESDWVESTQGSTIAYSAILGGAMKITTSGTTEDCGEISHAVIWGASKNCVIEARIKIDDIAAVGINVGWIDGTHNTNDEINFELDGSNVLINARGTDGAVFVFDTDAGADVWYVAAVKSDTEGTPVATEGALVPVNGTYINLRVALNSDGDATFYYNGVAVGFLNTAMTAATLMTPYVAVIARGGNPRVLTIDRITMWQDE